MLFFKKRTICPYCLVEIRSRNYPKQCPVCKNDLPVQYVHEYDQHLPFFVQVFGWSQVGKTVYQLALTLMLVKMSQVWPRYSHSAATDSSQIRVREVNQFLAQGEMPPITQVGEQEIYVMLLRNMERWGGRTLVLRDCAGEIFDTMEVPVDQAPFLLNTPTTLMFISLPDIPHSEGRTIDQLLNNYLNTLMKNGVDFSKERRKLVCVLTKADLIEDLPKNLRTYLINDPLWAAVNTRGAVSQLDNRSMQEYLDTMQRVSDAIETWIQQEAQGRTFVRLAKDKNIDLRFSLISSTGAAVDSSGSMLENLSPRRVLDPFFWAVELQSK